MSFPSRSFSEWKEQNELAYQPNISALHEHDKWWQAAFGRIENKLGPMYHCIELEFKREYRE